MVENANIIENNQLKEYLNKKLKPTKIKNRGNIDIILKEIDV
jgi:hypothetical protein